MMLTITRTSLNAALESRIGTCTEFDIFSYRKKTSTVPLALSLPTYNGNVQNEIEIVSTSTLQSALHFSDQMFVPNISKERNFRNITCTPHKFMGNIPNSQKRSEIPGAKMEF